MNDSEQSRKEKRHGYSRIGLSVFGVTRTPFSSSTSRFTASRQLAKSVSTESPSELLDDPLESTGTALVAVEERAPARDVARDDLLEVILLAPKPFGLPGLRTGVTAVFRSTIF
jgi:hypothetical protein